MAVYSAFRNSAEGGSFQRILLINYFPRCWQHHAHLLFFFLKQSCAFLQLRKNEPAEKLALNVFQPKWITKPNSGFETEASTFPSKI